MELQELAPAPSRVGQVLQYRQDQPTSPLFHGADGHHCHNKLTYGHAEVQKELSSWQGWHIGAWSHTLASSQWANLRSADHTLGLRLRRSKLFFFN